MKITQTKRQARHWEASEKKQVIGRWKSSGLSRKAFAERAGVSPTNLWRWEQMFGQTIKPATGAPQFVPVVIKASGADSTMTPLPSDTSRPIAEFVCLSGRIIRVYEGCADATIRQLIRAAEEI